MSLLRCSTLTVLLANITCLHAADWPRFRGPDGSGIAADSESLPSRWSPKANVAWKTPLPGPGVSSPIVVNGKVFVTCYSGYGLSREKPGEIENLMRHLVCIDAKTGKQLWQKDVKATLPEDPYSGVGVTAHGYASHTPVSDGENVYVFFGKGGVYAYDMEGKRLWQKDVGKESDPTKWGSSSSPIIHNDTVIVTASAESQSIVGLDRKTGKEVWRQEATALDGMWGTPTLVKVKEDRSDLVMCVAKEMWGLDPTTGKLRWYADATEAEHAYSSVVVDGTRVFAFTGRGGGSIAIDVDGKGDISEDQTAWTGSETASFGSPVRHKSKLYVIARGVVTVVDAETGRKLDQARLIGAKRSGGRFGSLDYPSPIVVGNRMFYLNGGGQMFVFDVSDKLKQIAVNQVTSNTETFGGTPAVSDGRLILRSSKHLYCVTDQGDDVKVDETTIAKSDDDGRGESREGSGRPSGAGNRAGRGGRFDPMSIFNDRDANKDGKLTSAEMSGNAMAERLKQLDKDGDKVVTKEEFSAGIATLFRGGRGSGGGNYRGGGKDTRPKRPRRPELAE